MIKNATLFKIPTFAFEGLEHALGGEFVPPSTPT